MSRVPAEGCFGDLKRAVAEESGVPVEDQRLICNKKQCTDQQLLSDLGVRDGTKVMLMLSDTALRTIEAKQAADEASVAV